MFKYFSKSDTLIDVFLYIKTYSQPKIIISDLGFLSNKNNDQVIKDVISDPYTVDFFIIDSYKDMYDVQDQLNNMIDTIYSQDVTNSSFFKNNKTNIDKINNIIIVKNPKEYNHYIYSLITDKFYKSSFVPIPKFFLLFSSVPKLIDFICRFNDNFENIYFILKPDDLYSLTKIIALGSFIEILLK